MSGSREQVWRDGPIGIIAVILMLVVLRALSVVVLPLVLAIFLAVLFWPILYRLDERLPRWVGISLVLSTILLVTAMLGWFFSVSVTTLGSRGDYYAARLDDLLVNLQPLADRFGLVLDTSAIGPERLLVLLTSGVQVTLTILTFIGFLFFVLALLLIELPTFQRKLLHGLSGERKVSAVSAVEELVLTYKRFFVVQTFVSVLTGLGTGLFLSLAGVEFAWIWAGVAFILNFIPNIGSVIAVIPPTLVATLQFDGFLYPFFVIVVLAIIQNVIGSYLNPRLMGRTVSLSPLVVLLSVLFWGWYWGVVGFFLAVPLTLAVRIICAHTKGLEPVALFLGNGSELEAKPVPPPDAMIGSGAMSADAIVAASQASEGRAADADGPATAGEAPAATSA